MHDLDLISTETIIQMRDRPKVVKWSKRMKDDGIKAAIQRKRRSAGRKAAETRRKNRELREYSAPNLSLFKKATRPNAGMASVPPTLENQED